MVRPRTPRAPQYGPNVLAALIFYRAVLGMPAGKRLAPILPELVPTLRRFPELDLTGARAAFRNKAREWVIAALVDIAVSMPFPLLGIDRDNGF